MSLPRQSNTFCIDRIFWRQYAAKMGMDGIALYCALVAEMDERRQCRVSIRALKTVLRCGQSAIVDATHLLESLGIVDVERMAKRNHRYTILLPVSRANVLTLDPARKRRQA